MSKKVEMFFSALVYLKELMLTMRFRQMSFLLNIFMVIAIQYAKGDEIVRVNSLNYEELNSFAIHELNPHSEFFDSYYLKSSNSYQQRRVSGKVTDANENPLPGVNVVEKGTTNGVLSNSDGSYSLTVVTQNSILIFSFIGFSSQELTVGTQSSINVSLIESATSLEEVVVIGYGTQKKATVTGAVTAIESKGLLQSPQANISNMMTGRVSGVITKQATGIPGMDDATVRIRGIGTFAGSLNPLIMIDGIEAQTYNNIDPNEIENISILKDASATAVYGVRGANGVLLITTKKGRIGKPEISYTSNIAITRLNDLRRGMGSYEWTTYYNEAQKYDSYISGSYVPKYSDTDIEHYRTQDDPIFYPNTDWVDVMIKPYSTQSQHNFNIRGGTKTIKYFVSIGYFSQESLFKNSTLVTGFDSQIKYNRYNFRSNFDVDFTKRLSANINLSSQMVYRAGGLGMISTSSGSGVGLVMNRMYYTNPISSPGIVDGKIVNVLDFFSSNPFVYYLGQGYGNQYRNNLNGSIRLNYSLDFVTEGLSVHSTNAYTNPISQDKNYPKNMVTYRPVRLPDNSISYYPETTENPFSYGENLSSSDRTVYSEFGINYDRKFNRNNISVLVLYNQTKQYPGPSLSIPRGYQGLVGRINYDLSGRYIAEFNVGYNGTENFAQGKRFGLFPAFSLGWVLSEENFFPKNKLIQFVKLRGSYGEVGNDQIGGSRFLYLPTTYTFSGGYYFGEVGTSYQRYQGAIEGAMGNPNLTWERAKKTDLGIDLTVLNSKLKITADWFQEKRDNILTTLGTVPLISGAILPPYNLGRMKNGGFDGDISYRNKTGALNYWVNINYTFAHNKILFQDEVQRPYAYQYRTGQTAGQPFGLISEGLYNTWEEVNDVNRPVSSWNSNRIQPGDIKFKDVNGDGIIDTNDQVPIGYSSSPEKFFGFSFGGDFKGLDISILFQGSTNVSFYPSVFSYRGWSNDGMAVDYLIDRSWTQEKYEQGDKISMPHIALTSQSHNYQTSNFWLENATYLRLKNFEIGYQFSNNLLKKIGVNSARFYINGSNILTWKKTFPGEDPELEASFSDTQPYPPTQVFNLGLNIKF